MYKHVIVLLICSSMLLFAKGKGEEGNTQLSFTIGNYPTGTLEDIVISSSSDFDGINAERYVLTLENHQDSKQIMINEICFNYSPWPPYVEMGYYGVQTTCIDTLPADAVISNINFTHIRGKHLVSYLLEEDGTTNLYVVFVDGDAISREKVNADDVTSLAQYEGNYNSNNNYTICWTEGEKLFSSKIVTDSGVLSDPTVQLSADLDTNENLIVEQINSSGLFYSIDNGIEKTFYFLKDGVSIELCSADVGADFTYILPHSYSRLFGNEKIFIKSSDNKKVNVYDFHGDFSNDPIITPIELDEHQAFVGYGLELSDSFVLTGHKVLFVEENSNDQKLFSYTISTDSTTSTELLYTTDTDHQIDLFTSTPVFSTEQGDYYGYIGSTYVWKECSEEDEKLTICLDFWMEEYGAIHDETIADNYYLLSNYPNPFNPTTKISYELQTTGDVNVIVYNSCGEMVWEAGKRKQEAGKYLVDFDGSSLNSGIYFYALEINGVVKMKRKMALVK